jgi:hypothetical protein
MRFKSLPESAQIALSRAVVDLLANAPAELIMPVAPASEWLAAFRKLNIKVGPDYLPTDSALWRAVDYLETRLGTGLGGCASGLVQDGTNTCSCCGTNF